MKLNTKSGLCIKYSLEILFLLLIISPLFACSRQRSFVFNESSIDYNKIDFDSKWKLSYSKLFSVKESQNYALIEISGEKPILLCKNQALKPSNVPENICILNQNNIDNTYLVSSPVMDLIGRIGALDNIKFTGTKKEAWTIEKYRSAMEEGRILYGGKYSAPDYELLLSKSCNLVIENTMIYHKVEVKEKLEELGIPVLVEKSSYEKNPLGKLEWIKLYGLLYNKKTEAENFFNKKIEELSLLLDTKLPCEQKVVFFYINSSGMVNVRRAKDYIAKMINMTGAQYFINSSEKEDTALSTMNMSYEDFYLLAKDANILIYNSTLGGKIESKENFLKKNPLFRDFKAFNEDKFYRVNDKFYQETSGLVDFMWDLHKIMTNKSEDLIYMEKVN